MRFFWGGHFEFFFLLHLCEKSRPFIWGIICFCTMDGFSRILEKKLSELLCTRLYVRIMSFQKGVKFLMFVLMIEKSRVKNFNFFHVSRRTRILPVILKNTMNFQTVVNSFMAWNTWSTVFRTWTNSKFMKYVLVTGYLTYNRWLPDYFITFIQKYRKNDRNNQWAMP